MKINYGAEAYRLVIDGYTLGHLIQREREGKGPCEDACVLCERFHRAALLAEYHDLPDPERAA